MNRSWLYKRTRVIIFLTAIALAASVATIYSAYRISRPVALGDEPINQTYLYGEGAAVHKGVDWSAADLGDSVYAVADGQVVDLEELNPNNCHPTYPPNDPRYCDAWGNFVLIQHDDLHYDRVAGQMSYVYSLYLHLRQNNVFVAIDQDVSASDLIAQADNSGNSTGDHLHLQIILHPQPNQDINTLESETRSRNPESWLDPLSNTASAIGKVTDTNGNPVENLYIHGLQKQTGWGYEWSETYSDLSLNPDDVLVENFGTTDITPGTYNIEAKDSNDTLYRDLGTHTFVAGQTTYVGLHPIYQPGVTVYEASNTAAAIAIRNNSDTHTAQVNITFFWTSGFVPQQETDMIAPQGGVHLSPEATAFFGSDMVVASEDISTVMEQAYTKQVAAYSAPHPPGQGDAGWEFASTDAYLPHVYNYDAWQYKSKVTIFNPGPATANVTITYRNPNGTIVSTDGPFTVAPFTAVGKEPPGTAFYGSAHISSDNQPVAVVADHFHNNQTVNFNYNALNDGFRTVYLPYLMKDYGGWNSCFVVRNLSGSTNNIQVTYYWDSGSGTYLSSVPGYGTQTFCQQNISGLPVGRALSARIATTNGRNMAVAVNQSNASAGSEQGWHMSYSGFTQPSQKVILPHLMKNASSSSRSWNSGIQIQNTGSSSTVATITYYNDSGQVVHSQSLTIPDSQSRGVYLPSVSGLPNPFKGTAVVTANQNLVAVVNATCTSGCNGGDYTYTYNGFNR